MSELSVGILTILAMICTIWWQSQHMSYIDFVHHAAYHPQCVSCSYLKLPLNVWMLLNQLGKEHDLLFMYLIFQRLCHSFPSHWQNLMLSAAQDFPVLYFQTLSHIVLSLQTHHTHQLNGSWTILVTVYGVCASRHDWAFLVFSMFCAMYWLYSSYCDKCTIKNK